MERESGKACKKFPSHGGKSLLTVAAIRKKHLQKEMNVNAASSSCSGINKKRNGFREQLLAPDYASNSVCRDFDFLPSGPKNYVPYCPENQGPTTKRKKVSKSAIMSHPDCNMEVPVKKHGLGKGLMTVWRAANPDASDLPIGYSLSDQEVRPTSNSILQKPLSDNKRSRKSVTTNGMLKNKIQNKRNKLQDKRNLAIQRRVGESNQYVSQIQPLKEKCDLALDSAISREVLDLISMLIDDEELELRELQAGSDLLMCSDHLSASGMLGCSLCKDVLVKFPPDSVKMKKPICLQPWDSSPEIVKKLFKIFVGTLDPNITDDYLRQVFGQYGELVHVKIPSGKRCGFVQFADRSCAEEALLFQLFYT